MTEIDDHVLIELFKLWIKWNPKELSDTSPDGIIEAWDRFKKSRQDKDKEHRKTRAYSEDI